MPEKGDRSIFEKIEKGTIVPLPSPVLAGFATHFREAEAIEISRSAAATYYQTYASLLEPHRVRVRTATLTGLPFFGNGRVLSLPGDPTALSDQWFYSPLQFQFIFGLPNAMLGEMKSSGFRRTNLIETMPDVNTLGILERFYHADYQIWYQERPVYGCTFSTHFTQKSDIAFSSSYLPIFTTRPTLPSINVKEVEALEIGLKTLWQYFEQEVAKYDKSDDDHLRYMVRLLEVGHWEAALAPYEKQNLFILPFLGLYRLAYRIVVQPPEDLPAWRMFIDAETGAVLGEPECLAMHAPQVFRDSGVLMAVNPIPSITPPTTAINVASQFTFKLIRGTGNEEVIDQPRLDGFVGSTNTFESQLVNVAYHAKIALDYVNTRLQPTPLLNPTALSVKVGRSANQLMTFFSPSSGQTPYILFQNDVELSSGGKIFYIGFDPEVIYHELMHGLMWLINNQPFDARFKSNPFMRAMLEGYAIYLARSIASVKDPQTEDANVWARGAYRSNVTQNSRLVWHLRWALSPKSTPPNASILPAPHLYPIQSAEGFLPYDVGMIWARALWKIRGVLGPELTDALVLESVKFVKTWIIGFEIAAEGLIQLAKARPQQVSPAKVDTIIGILDNARILAERSVQALHMSTTKILAGSDGTLSEFSFGSGGVTQIPAPMPATFVPKGIVAMAHDATNNILCAATESGLIYYKATTGWLPMPSLLNAERPFSLLADQGVVWAGTGSGVQSRSITSTTANWLSWGSEIALAFGLVTAVINGQTTNFRNSLLDLKSRAVTAGRGVDWSNVTPLSQIPTNVQNTQDILAAVTTDGSTLYIGTLMNGVYKLAFPSLQWSPVASPINIGNNAVTQLAFDGTTLYIGTVNGVFECDPATMTTHKILSNVCATSLIVRNPGQLVVGTSTNEIFMRGADPADPTGWNSDVVNS